MILRTRLLTVTTAVAAATSLLAATATLAADQLMAPPVNTLTPQDSSGLVAKLTAMEAARGVPPDLSFRIRSIHPGVAGQKVVRAQHTYKGLPVFGSESVVVTDAAGNIVSVSTADRRGQLAAGLAPSAISDMVPTLSAGDAIAVAAKSVAPHATNRWPPSAELTIYPVMKTVRMPSATGKADAELNALDVEEVVDRYELAYYVKLRLAEDGKPVYFDTIVNARTGAIIAQWHALKTVVGTGNSQYNGQVPIQTSQSGSTYQMLDSTRGTGGKFGGMAITNANHSPANNPDPGAIYVNTTNVWGDGQNYNGGSTTNANGQTAAVNALWGLMNTYDGLKNALGWHSLDGNNTATYIAAHVDTAYDNAFYDDSCKCMYIGDGSSFYSLGSIDVIGHEMSHGVTASTADLVYSGESGGLNESNSDIGGEMIEAYARNGGTGNVIPATGNDWMMGKEISKSGQPLRWMYKPSKDGSSPDAWSSTLKYLDVHYSSGPNNRMYYFLSQGSSADPASDYYSKYLVKSPAAMTGIGNDKAYRIWFKSLTTKFTSTTNYADARSKVLASAQELYGAGSKEAIAVQRAYAAINVGADVDESGSTGGGDVTITTQPASVTVAPGATASFSVGASGGTPPYSYKWMRNDAPIAGATSATYSLIAQLSDNGAMFNAVVSDSASPPKSATSSKATLTVTAGGGGNELVTNGGFEDGTTGWHGSTGDIGSFSGQQAYEGTRYAWMGGNGFYAIETLTQSVTIPSNATSAMLTFALHIDTDETAHKIYDRLTVTVRSSSGAVLRTLATWSNLDAADGYQIHSYDLSAFKGRTVTLSFAMREDSGKQTSFVLDKVSLLTK